jgi:hypothetical protein
MAVAISSLGCPPLRLSDTWRRWESTLAQLTFDLPGELHRLLGVLAQGGFEVHPRAAELEPLVARVERLGNRVAASVLTVAVIDGLADLARTDHRHPERQAQAEAHAGPRSRRNRGCLHGLETLSAGGRSEEAAVGHELIP